MKQLKKTLLTLVALLAVTTGAWATDPTVYESGQTVNKNDLKVGDIILGGVTINGTDNGGYITLIAGRYSIDGDNSFNTDVNRYPITVNADGSWKHPTAPWVFAPIDASGQAGNAWEVTAKTENGSDYDVSVVGIQYGSAAATAVEVDWNKASKTGTFTQPAGNVTVSVEYFPQAAFATTGTEPEVKTLLPEAAEGVIAGTDASLIAEGTGIVAFAGTSTEVTQGTLMYAIGTSATEAPALTAFSATVPTAENVADAGDVYVWYYIQGADAPDGQEATEENTFNDSEICTTPLTVTVLSNKFDLTLKAANVNTIDATPSSKGSVSVAGTDKTGEITDEGKLTAIKMGSEVKLNAKQGYKFRKVEVKKGEKLQSITIGSVTLVYVEGDKWSKIVERNSDKLYIENNWIWFGYGVLTGSGPVDPNSPIDTSLQYRWDG